MDRRQSLQEEKSRVCRDIIKGQITNQTEITKSNFLPWAVIPAKAGIQKLKSYSDSTPGFQIKFGMTKGSSHYKSYRSNNKSAVIARAEVPVGSWQSIMMDCFFVRWLPSRYRNDKKVMTNKPNMNCEKLTKLVEMSAGTIAEIDSALLLYDAKRGMRLRQEFFDAKLEYDGAKERMLWDRLAEIEKIDTKQDGVWHLAHQPAVTWFYDSEASLCLLDRKTKKAVHIFSPPLSQNDNLYFGQVASAVKFGENVAFNYPMKDEIRFIGKDLGEMSSIYAPEPLAGIFEDDENGILGIGIECIYSIKPDDKEVLWLMNIKDTFKEADSPRSICWFDNAIAIGTASGKIFLTTEHGNATMTREVANCDTGQGQMTDLSYLKSRNGFLLAANIFGRYVKIFDKKMKEIYTGEFDNASGDFVLTENNILVYPHEGKIRCVDILKNEIIKELEILKPKEIEEGLQITSFCEIEDKDFMVGTSDGAIRILSRTKKEQKTVENN
jgi:hypothetical protein